MKSARSAGLIAAAAMCFAAGGALAQTGPVVSVANGQVRGVEQDGIQEFLGIPYVAPPVGDLRWAPPQPAANWTGVKDATAYGPSCPQKPNARMKAMSEDCLTINVFTPSKVGAKTPVYVFYYGGGGFGGTSSGLDGKALAKRGIIVVTLNYRVGIMDTYVHPDLVHEQGGHAGNYGLQDAIAGLRWVKANISAFGGNPAKVTIGGESTGARLVASIIASPLAKGLFAGAIAESGEGWGLYDHIVSMPEAEKLGTMWAASLGAPSIAQMRAMPADQVVAKAVAYVVGHTRIGVLDGRVLVNDPHYDVPSKTSNDTPILSGFAYDEEGGFDPKFNAWTVDDFVARLNLRFESMATEAARYYPVKTDADALVQGRVLARDRDRMAMLEWAKRRSTTSKKPIYLFLFEHPLDARHGSTHGREGNFAFDNMVASADDKRVSEATAARWVAFIKTGSPNGPDMAKWAPFSAAAPKVMHIGDADALEPILPADKMKLSNAWGKMGGTPENGRGAFEPVPQ